MTTRNDYATMVLYEPKDTMAKVNYFLLCENAVIDQLNRVTLVNLFDQLKAPEVPVRATKFVIAISVNLNEADVKEGNPSLTTEVTSADGKLKVFEAKTPKIELTALGNLVSVLDLSGQIGFEKRGKYKAKLYLNDKPIDELIFEVQ